MILTLVGNNSYSLGNDLKSAANDFIEKYGDLSIEQFEEHELNLDRLKESLLSPPFLSGKKLLILRQLSKNKEFNESFEQIFNQIPDSTDVILLEPKLDKRLKIYKLLNRKTDFRIYPELSENELKLWLVSETKERGGNINSNDAQYLISRIGLNQQLISNELDKLLLYDNNITHSTIELLTESTPQSTIFQLLEAAFNGKVKDVFSIYSEQRSLKIEPQNIIGMLTWQLNILALIKTAGERSLSLVASEAKLNPYVLSKSQVIARRLTLNQIKQSVFEILKLDVLSKSVNVDVDEALKNYLLELAY